jgi:mannitol 2-dehydrogenase
MSCDNIPHNGHVARDAVAGLASLWDAEFGAWIAEHAAFPSGMVDRITPAASDCERTMLQNDFGIEDAFPVFCEDFTQWVLEDDFPAGRPALEQVGVQFVPDVTPYQHMKVRILNGGHAIIAYPAGLMDLHFVHEAMEHPLIDAFLTKLETEEVIPTVPAPRGMDLAAYFQAVRTRFGNPKIGDTVRRLCLDGSNRQPKFIIPTIADRLAAGASVRRLAPESALWRRHRAERSRLGPLDQDRRGGQNRPRLMACDGGHLRRCRARPGLRGGLFRSPDRALDGRNRGDPETLSEDRLT